jgi:hypothetical protein
MVKSAPYAANGLLIEPVLTATAAQCSQVDPVSNKAVHLHTGDKMAIQFQRSV